MQLHYVGRRSLVWTLALAVVLLNWTTVLSAKPLHQKPKANLSKFVVVGDSLSAGFQSGSLIETAQVNGYAALIANQAGVDLALPLIASPGIPNVLTLVSPGPPPVIAPAPGVSSGRVNPFLQTLNLAVPGARIQDALTTRPNLPVNSLTDFVLGFPSGLFLASHLEAR